MLLICNKIIQMFGSLKRNYREFNDLTLKTLYYLFLRSLVGYSSMIWSPYQSGHIKQIKKKKQKYFLHMMGHKL